MQTMNVSMHIVSSDEMILKYFELLIIYLTVTHHSVYPPFLSIHYCNLFGIESKMLFMNSYLTMRAQSHL